MYLLLAKIGLGLSLFLFFTDFCLACYCPWWYVIAACSAAFGAALGSRRIRLWSFTFFFASLIFAITHHQLKIEEAERFRAIQYRIQNRPSPPAYPEP